MKKKLVSVNKVLIHNDNCSLSYYINETADSHYGITVRKETPCGNLEEEYAERISPFKDEIYSLVLKLSENTVTPTTLCDIIYDYYLSRLINENKLIFANRFSYYGSANKKCI